MRVLGFRVHRHESQIPPKRAGESEPDDCYVARVETRRFNAYGAITLRLPRLECLLDKLRHNSVFGTPTEVETAALNARVQSSPCHEERQWYLMRDPAMIRLPSAVQEWPKLQNT